MNSKKNVCKLCGEELLPYTYSLTMEVIYMHNDLSGSKCRRIQKENKRKTK